MICLFNTEQKTDSRAQKKLL